MNELPNLTRELSTPPFVQAKNGTPETLPEIRSHGVIPDKNGTGINFAEVEPEYMPEDQLIVRVGEWIYISAHVTSKTKSGQSPQSEAIRDFVRRETGKEQKAVPRNSLRAHPGQLVLKLLPESYLPNSEPQDQA